MIIEFIYYIEKRLKVMSKNKEKPAKNQPTPPPVDPKLRTYLKKDLKNKMFKQTLSFRLKRMN